MARSEYHAMSYGSSAASVATESNMQWESRGSESDIDGRVKLDWLRWEQLAGVMCDRNGPNKLKGGKAAALKMVSKNIKFHKIAQIFCNDTNTPSRGYSKSWSSGSTAMSVQAIGQG